MRRASIPAMILCAVVLTELIVIVAVQYRCLKSTYTTIYQYMILIEKNLGNILIACS